MACALIAYPVRISVIRLLTPSGISATLHQAAMSLTSQNRLRSTPSPPLAAAGPPALDLRHTVGSVEMSWPATRGQDRAGGAVAVVASRSAHDPGPRYAGHLSGAESALDVPPVSKSFSGNRVLKEVAIRLVPGEVRGLAGLNGSGKSTLVKLLAGYHKPDEPVKAVAGGREFDVGDHDEAHSAGIRFVHQDLALIDVLDTVDNVGIGAGYSRRGSSASTGALLTGAA